MTSIVWRKGRPLASLRNQPSSPPAWRQRAARSAKYHCLCDGHRSANRCVRRRPFPPGLSKMVEIGRPSRLRCLRLPTACCSSVWMSFYPRCPSPRTGLSNETEAANPRVALLRQPASRASREFSVFHPSCGVKPITMSKVTANSPALLPGMGLNSRMTDSRCAASLMLRITKSFSFAGSPFT